jgi:ubiquinone/menaquinone biosynthesis C-methylase UbiE
MPTSLKDKAMEMAKLHGWGLILAREDELKRFLQSLFKKHKHLDILEIGCFKGHLVGWLHENFPRPPYSWNYWGVDIVEPPDRRRDYPHLVMNAEALEFPPNSFHAVIMLEVLEHVIDYVKALREIHRVLKPGGGVFIQSVVCSDPCALADETHFHVLHPKTLKRLMEWIGFREVQYVEASNFAIWGFK